MYEVTIIDETNTRWTTTHENWKKTTEYVDGFQTLTGIELCIITKIHQTTQP